eukprot:8204673-Pyramimonas_sp.AAC.1
MGEHPGWGGRALGRRRNIPPAIPEDRDHDGDITMSHADVFSSAQASSTAASAAIQQPPPPQAPTEPPPASAPPS